MVVWASALSVLDCPKSEKTPTSWRWMCIRPDLLRIYL